MADVELAHCLVDGKRSDTLVLFAHGAGAGMDHEFMAQFAGGIAAGGHMVVRFNFPYMQQRQLDGKRRPPDRAPKLICHFQKQLQTVIDELTPKRVVLMGKSMGGRMAALLSASETVHGVVCLGYPFAPKVDTPPRIAPLQEATAPILIIQGQRDRFGTINQVSQWPIPNEVTIRWLVDGDHSFKPRKLSGVTLAENMALAVNYTLDFIGGLDA